MEYIKLFLIILVFCACLIIYMSATMNTDIGDHMEIRVFRLLCTSFVIEIFMQFMWTLIRMNPALFSTRLNSFINCADLVATGTIVCTWFFFIFLKMTPVEKRRELKKRTYVLIFLPLAVIWFIDIASLQTGWIFYVNAENEYVRGPYYALHAFFCFLYYLMTLIVLFARRTRRRYQRSYVRTYAVFTLFPIVGGILQILDGDVPFTVLTVTIAVFYLYSTLQRRAINTDALTGLNNRARMEEFLSQKAERASSDPFWFYIADIDRFKSINDTYGHVSGDEALVITGEAIKAEGKKYHTFFAARYGGDEFVFTLDRNEADPEHPEKLIDSINHSIETILKENRSPYHIHLSSGSVYVNQNISDISAAIHDADQILYEHKDESHEKEFLGKRIKEREFLRRER